MGVAAHLWWTARGLAFWGVGAAAVLFGGCVLLILLIGAGTALGDVDIRTYVYPSPDRKVVLLQEVMLSGGATVGPTNEMYLAAGRGEKRVPLGAFFHGAAGAMGWVDSTTVNVCDLARSEGLRRTVVVTDARGGEARYRIATDCEPGYWDPSPTDAP